MEPNQTKITAKDIFLNLGAFIALYSVVITLLNLLFTIINAAYPQITQGYYYNSSASISWPVSVIIVVFPILIVLMWLLEKEYQAEPQKQTKGIHRWLSYITLFLSGIAVVGDLITVLYYFLNGEELTTGFLLKVLVVFVVSLGLFLYYITDIRGHLSSGLRKIWRIISTLLILISIIWGFSVLGSPFTQRQMKYDAQKVADLQNINNQVRYFYERKAALPQNIADLSGLDSYNPIPQDAQNNKPYEYIKTSNTSYQLCAEFNKESDGKNTGGRYAVPMMPMQVSYPGYTISGDNFVKHPAGRYCFTQTINPTLYPVNQYPGGKLPM